MDCPSVITGCLGKNWGFLPGALYFIILLIWVFACSTAITNDSASYLRSLHITKTTLAHDLFYGLAIIRFLAAIASRAERRSSRSRFYDDGQADHRLRPSSGHDRIVEYAQRGVFLIGVSGQAETIVLLPFTPSSMRFLQSLPAVVISLCTHNKNIEAAR